MFVNKVLKQNTQFSNPSLHQWATLISVLEFDDDLKHRKVKILSNFSKETFTKMRTDE